MDFVHIFDLLCLFSGFSVSFSNNWGMVCFV